MPQKLTPLKYPLNRGCTLDNAEQWINKKRKLDNVGDLWRVHDALYDLTDFTRMHPGGSQWITFSKGTDITEAFESHHLTGTAEKLLSNYYVKQADTPRKSPFLFKSDGFYKTLKPKIVKKLNQIPSNVREKSDKVTDLLLLTVLLLSLLCCWVWNINVVVGVSLIIVNSLVLSFLVTCAHSYFHRADNWRMYLFNLNGLSWQDWRISHSMSHHLFTNTSHDAELLFLEPYLQYLPYKDKSIWARMAVLYWPIITSLIFFSSFVKNLSRIFIKSKEHDLRWPNAIQLLLPLWMWIFGSLPLLQTFKIWLSMSFISSLLFSIYGFTSGHLNSTNFFEGNPSTEPIDWGLHQLRTVVERHDFAGKHFASITRFGDHALHHLFPTLDQAELQYLYPIIKEHCKEFGVELRTCTFYTAMYNKIKQLTSKT